MYTVVSDVEKYEEFLPFCCKSTVLRRLAPLVGEMYYLVSHCFADCSGRSESFRRHTQNREVYLKVRIALLVKHSAMHLRRVLAEVRSGLRDIEASYVVM
eukprot:7249223-Pyramimonas_sp.AAC.1